MDQLMDIVREYSEVIALMRKEKDEIVSRFEGAVKENEAMKVEREARDMELISIDRGREGEQSFDEGDPILDRLGGELEDGRRAEAEKRVEELKAERDAFKLEVESVRQAKKVLSAEADLARNRREELEKEVEGMREERDESRKRAEEAEAAYERAVESKVAAEAEFSRRLHHMTDEHNKKLLDSSSDKKQNPIAEKGTSTEAELEEGRLSGSIGFYLRTLANDLENTAGGITETRESANSTRICIEAVVRDLRSIIEKITRGDGQDQDLMEQESLVLLERRGIGSGGNNRSSGVTLLKMDQSKEKESRFASGFGNSDYSKIMSQDGSNQNSVIPKRLDLSPIDMPEKEEKEGDAQIRFSGRTFGIQEVEFETIQNEDQQSLVIRYQKQIKEMNEYLKSREIEHNELFHQNKLLKDSIQEMVERRTKIMEVADKIEDLDKEELIDFAGDLLEKMMIMNTELENEKKKSSEIRFEGSANKENSMYESEGRNSEIEEMVNKREIEIKALRMQNSELQEKLGREKEKNNTNDSALEESGKYAEDIRKIIGLYESQINNDKKLIGQIKSELQGYLTKVEELEVESKISKKTISKMAEEIVSLRECIATLQKYKRNIEKDYEDVKARANYDHQQLQFQEESYILKDSNLSNHKTPHKESSFVKKPHGYLYKNEKENGAQSSYGNTQSKQSTLKEMFGQEKIERSLNGIHIKLMEFINKNYVIRNKEAQMIHRDLMMKMIDLNKMVENLCNIVGEYKKQDQISAKVTKGNLKPLIQVDRRSTTDHSPHEQTSASPKTKISNKTQIFHEKEGPKPSRKLFTKSTDKRNAREYELVNLLDNQADYETEENQLEHFTENITVLASNCNMVTKRAEDLYLEYKKIDININQVIRYLSSSLKRDQLDSSKGIQKYIHLLRDSECSKIKEMVVQLKNEDIEAKVAVKKLLKYSILGLKTKVNDIKDLTRDRRDELTKMILKDRINVDGLSNIPNRSK